MRPEHRGGPVDVGQVANLRPIANRPAARSSALEFADVFRECRPQMSFARLGQARRPVLRPRSKRGVTLIELLVVMAIVGLIVAVSAPSAGAGLDSVRLRSASNSIASFLNAAVNHAERRQQPVAVIISPKENRLAAYSNEPGFTRELTLPDGIVLEAVLPQVQEDPESVRRLILMPGATVPGIGIQFANRHGGRRIVRLDPMTGFPRVESVNPQ